MGPAVREWISRNMRQTKGRWAGKPIEWAPFQVAYLDELYLIDMRTNLRVYTSSLLGLPKKNGKSTQAAGEALHGLCADLNLSDGRIEPSPEVYLGAKSRDQAGAVFRQASQFVKASPRLSKQLRTFTNTITAPEHGEGAFLKAMSGEAGTAHGINLSRGVIDELHEHPDDKLVNVFEQSGEAREQPLVSIITHAGYDEDGVLGERYHKFMGHADLENPERGLWIVRDREVGELFWWYGADAKQDDPADPETWMMTNPAPWITEERMARAFAKTKLANFQRFRLNMWVNVESSFLDTGLWASLRDDLASRFQKGEKVWAGVDIALRHDNSAVVLAAPTGDGRIKFKAFVFEHEEGRRSMKQRAMSCLRQIRQDYDLVDVAYDQAYFQDEAHELEDGGMPMVQYGQGTTMTKATQHFYQDAKDQKLCHDGDQVLSRHIGNAVVRETEAGQRITKKSKSSKKKIDAAVAAIMARELCAVSASQPKFKAFWA